MRWTRKYAGVVAVLCVALLAAACGSSSSSTPTSSSSSTPKSGTNSTSGTGASAAVPMHPSVAGVPSFIPSSVKSRYSGFSIVPVRSDPISAYKPPASPWKFCLAEAYTGNDFRVGPPLGSDGMLKKLVGQLQSEGLASGPLVETDSNNDVSVQLSQINTLVNEGCQIIFAFPGSSTGLCSAIRNAFQHGALVVSYGAETSCPDTVSVDANEYYYGYEAARALAESLSGKGSILMINAIPGTSSALATRDGALAAFKHFPGISVVGQVWGQWTPSIAKQQTLQFLSTHPGTIDGVWQAGLMSVAASQAFAQDGRSKARIEDFAGDCAELAFWKQQGGDNFAYNEAGEPFAYMAMQAAVRILRGAKPKSNMLLISPPVITQKTFSQWYKPTMTVSSTCYPNAPAGDRVSGTSLNPLFDKVPTDIPKLTYFTGKI